MKKKQKIISISAILGITITTFILINSSKYISTDNAKIKISNIQISSDVSGFVSKIFAQENDFVKKDQEILQIDNKPFLINYKEKKALYSYCAEQVKKNKELVKQEFISKSEFDKINSQCEATKEAMEFAKYKLENTTIKSPSDGYVNNIDLKVGDYVNEKRPLFNIIDQSEIWVEANFKEIEIENVKIGNNATVKVDAFSGKKWHAKVSGIRKATNSEFSMIPSQNTSGNWVKVTQRIMIKLQFTDDQDLKNLASGMNAEVKINTKD
jgi:membrane fusion protein, multidrug efflux system